MTTPDIVMEPNSGLLVQTPGGEVIAVFHFQGVGTTVSIYETPDVPTATFTLRQKDT